ncbi:MAG: DUF4332 domain-containing protein [Candidatus Bathyarchaeia archaeon]
MRTDYALYVLAIVFFIVGAVSVGYVGPLYAISTIIVGFLLASAGYLLKPKAKPASAAPPTPPKPEPEPQAVPAPTAVEATVAMVPKAESPLMETPPAKEPLVPATSAEAPATAAPAPAPAEAQVSPPAAEPAVTSTVGMELTQIRGINAKWADMLKANGVNSVQELANASSADLAAKLAVSEKLVKMWIGSAKKLVK